MSTENGCFNHRFALLLEKFVGKHGKFKTYSELAKKAGISTGTINKYSNTDLKNPNTLILRKLSIAVDKPADYLSNLWDFCMGFISTDPEFTHTKEEILTCAVDVQKGQIESSEVTWAKCDALAKDIEKTGQREYQAALILEKNGAIASPRAEINTLTKCKKNFRDPSEKADNATYVGQSNYKIESKKQVIVTPAFDQALFYRVKPTAQYLGLGMRKLYCLLDDKELNIDQRRIGGHLMNKKSGAVPRSTRLITQKGLDQLIALINEEKI